MRVVLLTTCIAVWVAGAAMLTQDLSVYRKSWASDLSNEAAILALSTAPALQFDDHARGAQSRRAAGEATSVGRGNLLGERNDLCLLRAPGSRRAAGRPPAEGLRMAGERIELVQPIQHNGEILGVIYLQARYDILGRMAAFLGIFVLVTLLSLAVAFLFSARLQARITEPLDAMARVARQIVSRRDYSLEQERYPTMRLGWWSMHSTTCSKKSNRDRRRWSNPIVHCKRRSRFENPPRRP